MTEYDPRYTKLVQMQSLPLDQKILVSKRRIKEWYEHFDGQVSVSFSGGADSTVLLHLVRQIYPEVKAVFVNTGLEYPEIVRFVKTVPNVEIVRPKYSFKEVLTKYGYPVISKDVAQKVDEIRNTKSEYLKELRLGKRPAHGGSHNEKLPNRYLFMLDAPFKVSAQCCAILKKNPLKTYQRKNNVFSYVGVMAEESRNRVMSYMQYACNGFKMKTSPQSRPLMFWYKQDILRYLKENNINYCKDVYGEIIEEEQGKLKFSQCQRTGCTFCMFGVHLEQQPNRFQRMEIENPRLYKYCMEELNLKKVLDFINVPYRYSDYHEQQQINFIRED